MYWKYRIYLINVCFVRKRSRNQKICSHNHPRSIWRCIMGWDHDRYRLRVTMEEERVDVDLTWKPSYRRWRALVVPTNSPSNLRPKARPLYLVARSSSASPSRTNHRWRIKGRRLEPQMASNYEDNRIILPLISQLGPTRTRTRRTRRTRGGSKTCVL